MKKLFVLLLAIIAVVMVYLGVNADALPPTLSGIAFVLIAALFYFKK